MGKLKNAVAAMDFFPESRVGAEDMLIVRNGHPKLVAEDSRLYMFHVKHNSGRGEIEDRSNPTIAIILKS